MQYERQTYIVDNPAAIKSVVLMDADAPVDVLSSGDSTMHVAYYITDKERYDIEVDDDILYIRKRLPFLVKFLMLREKSDDMRLTMYLPLGYNGGLNVAAADGTIRVDGIMASDVSANAADGDIRVSDVMASSLQIRTTDGDISVSRAFVDENVSCKTLDGDITFGSSAAAEASLRTLDGGIMLDRPAVSGKLSCRATDGDITGVLVGTAPDYTLIVRAGDGHSNVSSGGTGDTLCEIKTADGSVVLSFADER